jgi:AcrR family transcriptional regulator
MRAKPASQQRSEEKRERILDAMDSLLRETPFAAISIAGIAARAGVAPATIYQRFSNRNATASILLELYFRRVEEWAVRPRPQRRPRKQNREPGLYDALEMAAGDAWDQAEALGHIMRPAYLYSRQGQSGLGHSGLGPDLVGPDWARLQDMARAGFLAFLTRNAADLPPDLQQGKALEQAADALGFFFNMMLAGKLLHGDEPGAALTQDRKCFARTLAQFAHRYLTCRP